MTLSRDTKTLITLVLLLLACGLIVLSSAGVVDAQRKFNFSQYYLVNQLKSGVLVGVVLFFVAFKIGYKFWRKLALPLLLFSLLLMVLVFVPALGHSAKGATRWIGLWGFNFQPAEILKFSLIVYLAAWFSQRRESSHRGWSYSVLPFLVVLAFIVLMLALQPDIGTLGIVIAIAIALYWFAGAELKHFGALILVLIVGFFLLAHFSPYRYNRLLAFANPQSDTHGIAYHINQAKIAIGRGGVFGVGFGQSQQKAGFLPEPVGDSIFAIAVEELGLVGAGVLIALFLALAWKLIGIARNANDKFAQLYVLGVMVWILGQAIINMAAISGLLPLTGIPLPFVSYGGTALATLLGSLGVVANIANESA